MGRTCSRLVLVSLLVIGVAACGDDDTGSSTATETPTDLDIVLLTAAELGEGWEADGEPESDDDDDEYDGPECLDTPDSREVEDLGVDFSYTLGELPGIPSFGEHLYRYDDQDDLVTDFDESEVAGDSCGEFEFELDEETTADATLERVDFPELGTRAAAWALRLDTRELGVPITAYVAFVHEGDVVVSVMMFDLGEGDLGRFTELAEAAVAKVAA
jgi:hypothetical protein